MNMKEHSILFKPEMIISVLQNRKQKTRRTGNLEIINKTPDDFILENIDVVSDKLFALFKHKFSGEIFKVSCPYYRNSR